MTSKSSKTEIVSLLTDCENRLRQSPEFRRAGNPNVRVFVDVTLPPILFDKLTRAPLSTYPRDPSISVEIWGGRGKLSLTLIFNLINLSRNPTPKQTDWRSCRTSDDRKRYAGMLG